MFKRFNVYQMIRILDKLGCKLEIKVDFKGRPDRIRLTHKGLSMYKRDIWFGPDYFSNSCFKTVSEMETYDKTHPALKIKSVKIIGFGRK